MLITSDFNQAKRVLSRETVKVLPDIPASLKARLKKLFGTEDPERAVSRIVEDVRKRGDKALREYTYRIDGIRLGSLAVSPEEIEGAYRSVDSAVVAALRLAAVRITAFYAAERDAIWGGLEQMGGMLIRPLSRVGLYIPGGTAAYPSTVLMTAIPAKVAGVEDIILTTPARSDGGVSPLTLVAADIAGVSRIFSVGGAQGVAALAYGTESVPRVDKVCGPGNIFVMLAKREVYGVVDIDGLQGPSEVMLIADAGASPIYCAADLLAQAEHDLLASAILITTSRRLAERVNKELEKQLSDLPRREIARESLRARGKIIVVKTIAQAILLANLYAPEHLCLMVKDAAKYVKDIENAGAVFVGENTAEVLGDYVAGPSHALPTAGTARFASPLNVMDFIKFSSVVGQEGTASRRLWRAAAIIARAEGLEAHARAADLRFKKSYKRFEV
ncbi:MAG: histidinol dehydrogenase [Chloroflexota bacterium]